MATTLTRVCLILLLGLLASEQTSAQTCTEDSDISYADGTNTASYTVGDFGQSFTAPCDGYLNAVEMEIVSINAGTPAGTLYILEGPLTTGTVLASQAFTISEPGTLRFELSSPITLVKDNLYMFFFDYTSGGVSMRFYSSNPYPGGNAWQQVGVDGAPPRPGTSAIASADMDFTVDLSGETLPVEFTRFEAMIDGGDAVLHWETASETNNAGFEVEQQTGASWQRLGFVAGRGTTLEAQSYTYRATGLAPGRYRFRLRQVDYDGAFEYSPEVDVTIAVAGTYVLSGAYPNPFNPQTSFTLAVDAAQHVRVAVYDVLGRQVAQLHDGTLEAGAAHRFTFGGGGLPSGTYLLRVEGQTFRDVRQLVLAK